ncbi:hypothetical protein Tco_1280535, partial [Tanacetum coccineum]
LNVAVVAMSPPKMYMSASAWRKS